MLLGTGLVDSGSGYDGQSDLAVHFGLPGAQPVDVVVTILAGGGRVEGTVRDVDPNAFRGGYLTLRIDDEGRIVR
jgi:hypothetical protein